MENEDPKALDIGETGFQISRDKCSVCGKIDLTLSYDLQFESICSDCIKKYMEIYNAQG
jgi:hypothetical protein